MSDFVFDGDVIVTLGDTLDAAVKAARNGRAKEFLDAYLEENEHAAQNLGYGFGYFDEATRKEMYAAYAVAHPIFGSGFGR